MAAPDVDRPLHLLDSRSLWGGVWVLAIALFFAAGLPIIADVVRQAGLDPDEPFRIGDATILPVEGWALSENSNELFTVLEKGGATMTFVAPVESDSTPAESIDVAVAGFENDTTTAWAIGDPTAFTTDSGGTGVSVIARSPTDVSASWVVEIADGITMTIIGQAPDNVWNSTADEMEAIVRSVVHDPEGDG